MKKSDAGFSLIEVCLSMLIVGAAALACGQLFVVAMTGVTAAKLQTSTTILAVQKIEQLRALPWRFEGTGVLHAVSDTSTDLTTEPASTGGPGLAVSPASLDANTPGYVDYLDQHGRWTGTGVAPPAAAVFIRRWSVTPLPGSASDALVLRVLVTTVTRESQAASGISRRRLAGDALVSTLLTRKAW
jgi:hypothetical protein